MYGCPHCKTWLHEECVQEAIKRKSYTNLLQEEGEESLRAVLANLDLSAPPPPPVQKKAKGKGPAGKALLKGLPTKDVNNPTIEQLDKIFEVSITVNVGGQVTRAAIRDIRPKKDGEGGEDGGEHEETVVEQTKEREGEGEGENLVKVVRKKNSRREWEEDVLCLLCDRAIY